MSQVIIQMGEVPTHSVGGSAPVMVASTVRSEEITSSGTAQATTLEARKGDCVTIKNNGSQAIWADIGASPTAAVETLVCIMPNGVDSFSGLAAGDKVSIINDS